MDHAVDRVVGRVAGHGVDRAGEGLCGIHADLDLEKETHGFM